MGDAMNEKEDLRQRAERMTQEATPQDPELLVALSPEETQQIIYELRVHQIELEMQNEELRQKQVELDTTLEMYFDLYELAPVGYCTLSEQGQILKANLTAAGLLGAVRGGLLKHRLSRFILPEDQDIYYRHRSRLFETGEPQTCELRLLKFDGTSFWAHLEATAGQDPEGAPICRMVVSDITERKWAEEELRASGAKLRSILNASPDDITITDLEGCILGVSPAALPLLGCAREEDLVGHRIAEFIAPEDQERAAANIALMFQGVMTGLSEYRGVRPDGSPFDMEVNGDFIRSAEGQPTGLVFVVRDVTERKRSEKALRASNELLSLFVRHSPVYAYIKEVDSNQSRVLVASENFQKMIGIPGSAMTGKTMEELYPAETAARINADDWMVVSKGEVVELAEAFEGRSYTTFKFPIVQGTKTLLAGFTVDITERKEAEEALQKSQGLLEAALANSPSGILIADAPDVRIRFANAAALGIRGKPSTVLTDIEVNQHAAKWQTLRPDGSPFASEELPLSRAVLEGITTCSQDAIIRDEQGVDHWITASAAPIRDSKGEISAGIVVFHDITERKQAEEENAKLQAQLQQAQKMESLGNLAGGVAHDMNNVLGAILGMATANIEAQPVGSPAYRAFDTIIQASTRGGKMVKSLLSFARHTPAEELELAVNELLREEIRLLSGTTLAKVRLEWDLAENLRPIRGDAGALINAIMNLCVNAVDAMPEQGTLTLRTRNVDNDWIEVIVEDTGTGMPQKVLDKAMEPFYTTKEVGKGTGLGLSMVYNTVTTHRGQMKILSEQGQGTRVMMRFPACESLPQTHGLVPVLRTEAPPRALQVLAVDDDELIQCTMQALLEIMGHKVTIAPCGEEALAMLEAGFQPDVIILDMNMPGLGGDGTLPLLRALRPSTPVLLATGRVDQFALDLAGAYPHVTLLSKPFSMGELQLYLEPLGRV